MIGERVLGYGLTSVVVLSLWLGAAIVVAAVVAPAAFAVLPTRTLAGALVGRVLPVLFWSGAAVGLLVAAFGRAQAHAGARAAGVLLVAACLVAQLGVGPRIARIRADAGGPIDRLARDDARRVAFGRLHAASVALLGVAAVAGSAALVFTLRALATRTTSGFSNLSHEP